MHLFCRHGKTLSRLLRWFLSRGKQRLLPEPGSDWVYGSNPWTPAHGRATKLCVPPLGVNKCCRETPVKHLQRGRGHLQQSGRGRIDGVWPLAWMGWLLRGSHHPAAAVDSERGPSALSSASSSALLESHPVVSRYAMLSSEPVHFFILDLSLRLRLHTVWHVAARAVGTRHVTTVCQPPPPSTGCWRRRDGWHAHADHWAQASGGLPHPVPRGCTAGGDIHQGRATLCCCPPLESQRLYARRPSCRQAA